MQTTIIGKLSHNSNVIIRQFNNGERTVEVAIRGQHVFGANRRFGIWTLGNINTPDNMTLDDIQQMAKALNDAHEYINNLSK